MKPTVIEDIILEFEPSGENDYSALIAAEHSWRGMADELEELHYLKGAQFINQLKLIIYYGDFNPVEGETNIFSAISEQSDDFDNLINAARKAVHGKGSVGTQLFDSIGQTNRVLLNITTDYNTRLLASDIKRQGWMDNLPSWRGRTGVLKETTKSDQGFLTQEQKQFHYLT